MEKRLRVLISAYACEPGKGSEPEVGWRWSLEMAKHHHVTVLTRANNRTAIEAGLAMLPEGAPKPDFIYHDADAFMLRLKKRWAFHRFYYIWWQRSARRLISGVLQSRQFDLIHHVTFAGYRYITAIWGHGIPSIWGPVGGMESIDWRFLPYKHPWEFLSESARNISNLVQHAPTSVLGERAALSTLVIASTKETADCFRAFRNEPVLLPTIGLDPTEFPEPTARPPAQPGQLRLLFVGQIIWLKGVDLAIEALAASGTDASLHFIGSGPFRKHLNHLINRLGLVSRVTFEERIPRKDLLSRFSQYDVFLFPSLHESGGFAVLEAMANCLPVICLDCGGPALSVAPDCGVKIPLGRRKNTIALLASAIYSYSNSPALARRHGENARQRVLAEYAWENKGHKMNTIYRSLF